MFLSGWALNMPVIMVAAAIATVEVYCFHKLDVRESTGAARELTQVGGGGGGGAAAGGLYVG